MPRTDAGRRRCAIYTRKSSEEGLEQEFNSLAAQREACEAYILSQQHEGWMSAKSRYDDGGFSGGNLDRPALQDLLADIRAGRIDIVIVYKVDRLTRSLADFARLVELFDAQDVASASVAASDSAVELTATAAFTRRGAETKLVLPGLAPQKQSSRCDPALSRRLRGGARGLRSSSAAAPDRSRSWPSVTAFPGATFAVSLASPS